MVGSHAVCECNICMQDPSMDKLVRDEIKMMESLEHENVVKFLAADFTRGAHGKIALVLMEVQSLALSLLSSCNLFSPRIHLTGDLPNLVTRRNHSHCTFSPLIYSPLIYSYLLVYTPFVTCLLLSPVLQRWPRAGDDLESQPQPNHIPRDSHLHHFQRHSGRNRSPAHEWTADSSSRFEGTHTHYNLQSSSGWNSPYMHATSPKNTFTSYSVD